MTTDKAQADAIEAAVNVARRAQKVDQAILTRAFRGELQGSTCVSIRRADTTQENAGKQGDS